MSEAWRKPDGKVDWAAATAAVRELRRTQAAMVALAQQVSTSLAALMADDWEDRYLAEGMMELERFANNESPPPDP